MNFAFYGQAITTDRQQGRTTHVRQLADATTRVEAHGGHIVRDYFDTYPDQLRAWPYHRHAMQLLKAIENPHRGFAAIVIGDTRSAFPLYHHYDETQLWCAQHDVQLWVPEIDGAVDPDNTQHAQIMTTLLWA